MTHLDSSSDRPKEAHVKTVVSQRVHDNVRRIAELIGLSIPITYRYILTRELFDIDASQYALQLADEGKLNYALTLDLDEEKE